MFRPTFLFLLGTIALISGAFAEVPFKLSVVPSSSTSRQGQMIYLVGGEAKEYQAFHVILTNVSSQPQPVFEAWNSWGCDAISFELTLPGGKKAHVVPSERFFTMNYPSTFLILPGESLVYPIRLDHEWKNRPTFAKDGLTSIKLVAIYQVYPSPDTTKYGVWSGSVRSKSYAFVLNHSSSDD